MTMQLFILLLFGLLSCTQFSYANIESAEPGFIEAAVNGNMERVKSLLKEGVSINSQTQKGHTALMLAAGKGQTNVVKFLIEAGADVNIQAGHKETALHLAAGFGHKGVVELLLTNRDRKSTRLNSS